MAKKEGWYSKNGSKWQTMEDLMLRYRAATFFGRLYTPDLLMGMQTKEELDDVIDVKIDEPESPKVDLNALAAKKETQEETQKPEEKPADPFLRLKIELRKMGVNPAEAEAFIGAQNIQPEDIAIWTGDIAALKATYENYKEAKAAFAA